MSRRTPHPDWLSSHCQATSARRWYDSLHTILLGSYVARSMIAIMPNSRADVARSETRGSVGIMPQGRVVVSFRKYCGVIRVHMLYAPRRLCCGPLRAKLSLAAAAACRAGKGSARLYVASGHPVHARPPRSLHRLDPSGIAQSLRP